MLVKTKRAKLYPHKLTGCYFLRETKKVTETERIDKLIQKFKLSSECYYCKLPKKGSKMQGVTKGSVRGRIWLCDKCYLTHGIIHQQHKGSLSSAAKSKVTAAIHALRLISDWKHVWVRDTKTAWKFRMNFITFTLPYPQVHNDKVIMTECFNPMLKYLTQNAKMNSYVWKCEAQKNGDIHFHVTTNVFIHYSKVQKKWNQLINKLGYVDRYFNETGDDDPHTTEIKAVRNDNRLASYIAGELTKKDNNKNTMSFSCPIDNGYYTRKSYEWEQNNDGSYTEKKRVVECRLWGSSCNLTNNFFTYIAGEEGVVWELGLLKKESFYKTVKHDYGFSAFFKFNAHRYLPEPFKADIFAMIKYMKKYEPKTGTKKKPIEVDSLKYVQEF